MRGGATDAGRFPTRMLHEMRQATADGTGGTTESFDSGIAVWTRIAALPAAGGQATPDSTSLQFRVTLRFRPIAAGDRLRHDTLLLTVRRATDPDGSRRLIVCDCTATETGL